MKSYVSTKPHTKRQVLISKIEKSDNVISPYSICISIAKMPNINTVLKAATLFCIVTLSLGLKNVIAWAQHFHVVLDLSEAFGPNRPKDCVLLS